MSSVSVGISVKRKGKGKRCLAGQRVAGRADRAHRLIARWQAEASGDVAAALAGLALAVADRDALRHGAALVSWWGSKPAAGEDHAAPQQLRQDW